jgi:1,4-alpha-glucan branching enzyme
MYGHPGKKLLFMGNEIAQSSEWNHDQSLDWHLLQYPEHAGVQALLRDLNHLYTRTPALYEIDFSDEGFEWIDWGDRDNSILSWLRRDRHGTHIVCITNLTPVVRQNYRVGLPDEGSYGVTLNTDDTRYGGSGTGMQIVEAVKTGHQGRPYSTELTLPPLGTIYLEKR